MERIVSKVTIPNKNSLNMPLCNNNKMNGEIFEHQVDVKKQGRRKSIIPRYLNESVREIIFFSYILFINIIHTK